MSNKRSVILRQSMPPVINEEGVASEAIKPGYMVTGPATVAKQTGTTGYFQNAIALERDEMGKGIDDTFPAGVSGLGAAGSAFYASGDKVKVAIPYPGMETTAWVASGQNITAGDLLQSAGNGLLAEGSTRPVATAMETLGAVTAETALRVQWL
jgi:hypothetical protein